jgi:hypothetical protein
MNAEKLYLIENNTLYTTTILIIGYNKTRSYFFHKLFRIYTNVKIYIYFLTIYRWKFNLSYINKLSLVNNDI